MARAEALAGDALLEPANALLEPELNPCENTEGEPLDGALAVLPLEAAAGAWETPALEPEAGTEEGTLPSEAGVKDTVTTVRVTEVGVVPDEVVVGAKVADCAGVDAVPVPIEIESGDTIAGKGKSIDTPNWEGT